MSSMSAPAFYHLIYFLFNLLQLILSCSQADLFCLVQSCFPFYIRVGVFEMIVMTVPSWLCQMLSKLAVFDRRCLETGICTCLIKSYRVIACEHSEQVLHGNADGHDRLPGHILPSSDPEAHLRCCWGYIRHQSCRLRYSGHSPCIYHNQ